MKLSADLENVIHFNYVTKSGEVFCKRQDKVRKIAPDYKDCDKCPYLFGSLQGQGVECFWEDVVPSPSPVGYVVYNPNEELSRVSVLVQNNILKKG